MDEIAYGKGHDYLTLVYQIDTGCTRLLWVGEERTKAAFQKFFDLIGTQLTQRIEFVCSDRWKPYLDLIKKNCTAALNILDRFDVVAKLNLAIDEIRSGEARQLIKDGYEPILKKSRWCLLKRPENLTDTQPNMMPRQGLPCRHFSPDHAPLTTRRCALLPCCNHRTGERRII